jgi:hypothetical protein
MIRGVVLGSFALALAAVALAQERKLPTADPVGRLEVVATFDGPDTLSLAKDGYLYFTANQLHRQKQFHEGKDLRRKPYALFRVDGGPVLLRRGG